MIARPPTRLMAVAIVVYVAHGSLGRAAQLDGILGWIRLVGFRMPGGGRRGRLVGGLLYVSVSGAYSHVYLIGCLRRCLIHFSEYHKRSRSTLRQSVWTTRRTHETPGPVAAPDRSVRGAGALRPGGRLRRRCPSATPGSRRLAARAAQSALARVVLGAHGRRGARRGGVGRRQRLAAGPRFPRGAFRLHAPFHRPTDHADLFGPRPGLLDRKSTRL